MPAHTHNLQLFLYNGTGNYSTPPDALSGGYAGNPYTSSAGGGAAHNNLPPYVLIAQIIKVKGVQVDSGGALVGPAGPAGAVGGQAFTQAIGNGAATSFVVVHNLNTQFVTVSVFRTAAPYDEVIVDVERTDANRVTIRTSPVVLANNELTVVVAAAGTVLNPAPTPPQKVTVLPTTGLVDGLEVYYSFTPTATPANAIPVIWHLRYDLASGKWFPVGEQLPLQAFYGPGVSTSMGSGAWGTYDANDPRVTLPLTGIFDVETGVSEAYGGVAINFNVGIGFNGAVVSDREGGASSSTAGWPFTGYANARGQALNANDIVRQYYFLSTAGPQNVVIRGRYISVRPRRIG
jgi:hypothetical protein